MNITITKDDLSTALRRVHGAVASRLTLPILSCVLLRAKGESLQLLATNLDIQISHTVPAGVLGTGEAALPITGFTRYVNEFPSCEIEINVDGKFKATMKSGAKRTSLSGVDAKKFVEFAADERKSFTVEQSQLKSALKRALISVSVDETRAVLNGVLFELKDGTLAIVSTSGTQLSRTILEVAGDDIRATLPTKAATEVARLLSDAGDVIVAFGSNTAQFIIGDTVITSKLIGEVYPNCNRVIPSECAERITISREEFLSSIRLVNSVEVDAGKFPKILATFERHRLKLSSAWQTADADDSIAINYIGKDMAIPLAPDQVANILSVLTDDEVHIELTDHLSPFVIKAGNFLGLTMPYRPT